MATRSFDLTTTVPVAPEAAIDFLVDLARHHGLHPYLVTADVVASGEEATGAWNDWRVVERPRLGPFRYTIRFTARMTRTSPESMRGDVTAAPGCTLVTTTRASGSAASATLHESTVVTAPFPLVGYMTRQARLAHARTFSMLPSELAKA
ncbi:MAG TPA: hypothetical protein VFQ74_03480 [Pseudolysinimonas sp.]|nr:hypothetical protein [Pseudolysinimonas sp.]